MDKREARKARRDLDKARAEISRVVVGQEGTINSVLRSLLADGNVLVEGMPGVAKTLLIRALGEATGCKVGRVQFTVDLLPTDIVGMTTYHKDKGFVTVKGPVFVNFLIADEINRASPKTQSALLEAMQERQVTIGKRSYHMMRPFLVMANHNPIESTGVYPLPEAQVDRFLFKLYMDYPTDKESADILETNITLKKFEEYKIKHTLSPRRIVQMQRLTKSVEHSSAIKNYIVRIVSATRSPHAYDIRLGKYIMYGGSPRAGISMFIAAKADAIMKGDNYITPQHVKNVAHDVLRHRIVLDYKGQAEGVKRDDIIAEILEKVPVP